MRSPGVAIPQVGVQVPSIHVAVWLALPGVVVTWLVTGLPDLSGGEDPDMEARHDTSLTDARSSLPNHVRVRLGPHLLHAYLAGSSR